MTDAIGVLPEQVPASSNGQFFDVEYYFLNSLVIKSKKGNGGGLKNEFIS